MLPRFNQIRALTPLLTRPSAFPAFLALVLIVSVGLFADAQNRRLYMESTRAGVLNRVNLMRAKLEGNILSNIQLVRGLVATIATEPGLDEERFQNLVSKLPLWRSQIRNIAVAPDLVVSMTWPAAGNEKVIGLDYRTVPAQYDMAVLARESGELVMAGPLALVQGGTGLIGRFPVFVGGSGQEHFWGLVSAVIDLDKLFVDSGLFDPDMPVQFAIVGRNATGSDGDLFFGRREILSADPVTVDVSLPSGSWRIAAVPTDGWSASPPNSWMLWLLVLFAGGLILLPTTLAGRLIDERTQNVGELKRREIELGRLSRRLGLALETSQVGVWEMDIEDNALFWDDRMNELYGYPRNGGQPTCEDWAQRIHPDDRVRAVREFHEAIAARSNYRSDYRVLPGDDTVRHIRAIGKVYQDAGEPARIVGVNWDVSADVMLNDSLRNARILTEAHNNELMAAKARIEFNAMHDSLTGLPNRRYLDERLARHVAAFDAHREKAGLLHIDLDRFKQINDTLGHAAGDAMLVHAARVLKDNLREDDFVARVGGDEFVVLCIASGSEKRSFYERLSAIADRIIERMREPVRFQGAECRFGVSIGIASDFDALADARRLLVNADIALYHAKSLGRARYQFFNETLQAEIVTSKRIADDILAGIERREFVAYYQPQFDAVTHEVVGVEALARWNHPAEGLLPPIAFMKIAEEINAVATIDRLILEQTLKNIEDWTAAGLKIRKASVNVSARRLHDEHLIHSLRNLNIRPGTLSFELVESIFLDENDELITWNVEQIKNLGIDIEVDDFGTGHASIVSLLKVQPKRLKIDRQLVTPVVSSSGQRRLVGSIIEIGKSLGIEVLAEGVETMEHARVLKSLGCNALQGYAFAQPMSPEVFAAFMKNRGLRHAS